MIDSNKPVRFVGGHGRVRVVGNDGMGNMHLRYHDEGDAGWRTMTVDTNGWQVRANGKGQAVENYEIDFDRPVAFQDTGDRGHLVYFPGTEDFYGVSDMGGDVYWFTHEGMPIFRKDGLEIAGRHIMNVETEYTRRADAAKRVAIKRASRAQDEQHPLWGMF